MTKVAGTTILLVILALAAQAYRAPDTAPTTRRFEIRYAVVIPAPPPGAQRLRAWLPYPESDAWQTIDGVVVSAPFPHQVHHDREYGNSVLFFEAQPPPT